MGTIIEVLQRDAGGLAHLTQLDSKGSTSRRDPPRSSGVPAPKTLRLLMIPIKANIYIYIYIPVFTFVALQIQKGVLKIFPFEEVLVGGLSYWAP